MRMTACLSLLAVALMLPVAAFATGAPPPDNHDTDTDAQQDTDDPVDTGAPGDTGPFVQGRTSADLAEEEGGTDCSGGPLSSGAILLLPLLALGRRERS